MKAYYWFATLALITACIMIAVPRIYSTMNPPEFGMSWSGFRNLEISPLDVFAMSLVVFWVVIDVSSRYLKLSSPYLLGPGIKTTVDVGRIIRRDKYLIIPGDCIHSTGVAYPLSLEDVKLWIVVPEKYATIVRGQGVFLSTDVEVTWIRRLPYPAYWYLLETIGKMDAHGDVNWNKLFTLDIRVAKAINQESIKDQLIIGETVDDFGQVYYGGGEGWELAEYKEDYHNKALDQNTYCPKCREAFAERDFYEIQYTKLQDQLRNDGEFWRDKLTEDALTTDQFSKGRDRIRRFPGITKRARKQRQRYEDDEE